MNKPKLKPVVSFINEAPTDGEHILKDLKIILAYDKASGKIGSYWYGLKPTDKDGVYTLTDRGILVPRILTNVSH